MRSLRIGLAGCTLAAAIVAWPSAGWPTLPLQSPAPATTPLLAVASIGSGSRLVQLDPATFAAARVSSGVAWEDGWVVSPDRRLLAVATQVDSSGTASRILFANVSTLRWVRQGVWLDGSFLAAIWPEPGTLYALTASCCGSGATLDTVDTAAKRVVARTMITGVVTTVARSADGLVLLRQAENAIAPATLTVVDASGGLRSVRLTRILAGLHVPETSQDPIATIRQPGLAVDAAGGVAYVVDPDGLIAEIDLHDLAVSYHRPGRSLLDRVAGWLTPSADAKGVNGPTLGAQWLGDGLIAVTGTTQVAVRKRGGSTVFSSAPAGLRLIDVRTWSERTLDAGADSAVVADGVLLAAGGSWRFAGTKTTSSGEGLVAYAPDGTVRWRLHPGQTISVLAAYGSRALVQKVDAGSGISQEPVQLIDLGDGHTLRTLSPDTDVWPLVGSGS